MIASADAEGLFEILANYLNFSIDFLRLRGMEDFQLRGVIDKDLVAFFVAGATVAFLMATIKHLPTYDEVTNRLLAGKILPKGPEFVEIAPEGASDKAQLVAFVVISVVGSCIFHGILILYARWLHAFPHGGIKDTLNGTFAFNAVYMPLDALLKKAQQFLKTIAKAGGGSAIFAAVLQLVIAALYFTLAGLSVWALAQVHHAAFWQMFWPAMIAGILIFILIFIPIFLWFKNRDLPDQTTGG